MAAITDEQVETVRALVASIPQGRVSTYGDIARFAGRPGAARAVGKDYPIFAPQALTTALAAAGLKVLKGDHFPSDILAGLAIGAVAGTVAEKILPVEQDER